MFSGDSKESKNDDNKAKADTELAQVLLPEGNEVENDPDESEHRHEHIQAVGLALPVAEEAERAHLHEHLDQEDEREEDGQWGQHAAHRVVDLRFFFRFFRFMIAYLKLNGAFWANCTIF